MAQRANPLQNKADKAREALKHDSTGVKGSKAPQVEETRATFIVDKKKLKALKMYAVKHEIQIKDAVDMMLTEFLENHK